VTGRSAYALMLNDGTRVSVGVQRGLTAAEFSLAETTWRQERDEVRHRLVERDVPFHDWPQSLHWDWMAKTPLLRRLEVTGTGLVSDGAWEALMLTKSASYQTQLAPDRGKPVLYLDYVEVAPRNWAVPQIGQCRRLRGLGPLLIADAVLQSLEEGFHGRLALHALPQAEAFYEHALGFTRLGADPAKQGLVYFELTRDAAARLLEKGEGR
jgi:hypothetical protein